jgi:hypothetical protein
LLPPGGGNWQLIDPNFITLFSMAKYAARSPKQIPIQLYFTQQKNIVNGHF